jgi:uncharacterized protein DUF3455
MNIVSKMLLNAALRVTIKVSAQALSAIVVPDAAIVATFHAEGAQIYECKPDSGNKPSSEARALTWQFREPIATLIVDGKSIGRHYAGPSWDHIDGSGVRGRVAASAPGATSNDIPWLRLDVVDHRGSGILSDVTTVQRINTKGGIAQGPCESAGDYLSVPYSADYVFLRKSE